jgi:hypothetical protein
MSRSLLYLILGALVLHKTSLVGVCPRMLRGE